jgi:hypothetical protein
MDYKNPFFLTVLDKGYNSIETARNLKINGIPLDVISKCVGLTESEIEAL